MHRLLLLTALTLSGLAQTGAAAQEVTAPPGSTTAGSTLVALPRYSSDGANTRVVFDLPAGASYGLEVIPEGLRLRSATLNFQISGRMALGRNGIHYLSKGTEAVVQTPYRLTELSGWRATEATIASGQRVLILDLGATLQGGAGTLTAKVQVVSPAVPAAVPTTLATSTPALTNTPPTVVEDGRQANVVQGGWQLSDLKPTNVRDSLPVPMLPTPAPALHPHSGLRGVTAGNLKGGTLTAPRIGKNPGMTRVVLDLPAGVTYQIVPGREGLLVKLTGISARNAEAINVTPELLSWNLRGAEGGVLLTLKTANPTAENSGWHGLLLAPDATSPLSRLVLDISPAHANTTPLRTADKVLTMVPRIPSRTGLATLSLPVALVKPRVILDPGHGGRDPGAVGALMEKEVTLKVSRRVRALLEAAGVEVVMTREDDRELHPVKNQDLLMRSEMALGSQLFVSVHANATPPENAVRGYGVETWWNPNHPHSGQFAQTVQGEVIAITGAFDRGTKNSQLLGVLRQNPVPAVLIEMGFISHPVDGLNLKDEHYLERVAVGIARGIHRMLTGQ